MDMQTEKFIVFVISGCAICMIAFGRWMFLLGANRPRAEFFPWLSATVFSSLVFIPTLVVGIDQIIQNYLAK